MKFFQYFFAIFGILFSKFVFSATFDFFKPDEKLGKMEYHEHRGLKVYFFNPLYGAGVDKVVVGNQGVWQARSGQTLTKVVGFFRCMGFGLSHVTYFKEDGTTKDLLLGYDHGAEFLKVVEKDKFYDKLMSYTNTEDDKKFNPNIPGHPVLHELEALIKSQKSKAEQLKEVVKEMAEDKRVEVPASGEAHSEL